MIKKWEAALIAGLICTIILSTASFSSDCKNIREDVFRVHILANSDSTEDQELKLKVRDKLQSYCLDMFKECESSYEAQALAQNNLDIIQTQVQNTVYENGYDYGVSIEVGNEYFSTRDYENFTLPAGQYKALVVKLGKAEGKNWWCCLYPTVCINAASENNSPDDVLNSSELEIVENKEKYEVRLWIVELFESIKEKF